MYKNQLIFSPVHGKGQQFVAPKENGDTLSQFAIANIGYIAGNKRQIDAIMTDLVMDGDKWNLYNIVNSDNIYIKSVAVLGIANIERGRYLALRYFGEVEGVGIKANWIGEVSHQGIKRFLDHDQSTYQDRITSSDLEQFEKFITADTPSWSEEKLISHSSNLSYLMLDMLQNDEEALLLDSMNRTEFAEFAKDLQDEKEDLYLVEDQQLDALITPYGRLDLLIQRLSQALGKIGNSKVNVTSITPTKPFKRNSVVNVAVLLEFDDGQTVSIVFHNPDATPSKLASSDVLTSWKWLLNKRDVSVVLQPQNGENVNLTQLAMRMMQLVNKNSARFKRTQVKRAENEQKLIALQGEEQTKLSQIQSLDAELAALQLKIDEANNTDHAAVEQAATEQAAVEQAAAEQAAVEQAAAEQAAAEQAAAEQAAAEQAAAEQAAVEQAAAEQAAAEQAAAEQAAAEQAAAEQAAAEQAAAEQAAAEQAAAEQAAAEQAAAEQAAAEQAAAEQAAAEQAAAEQAAAEQAAEAEQDPATNTDREYLQSILDGQTDLEDLDAIETKLTDIWGRAEGTDLEPLVKEVSNFISNYALNSYNETVA
ncbi:defense against restriction DarA-related protein [Acinetobacter colistiniresistens]|uniref:defense against restriction DarA-related protein n=1 Tax=Acinetobacter colistiniresistens TaxID=280145 RepID=UPI00148F2B13|nr:hypothetical protein [Acinetobacter colistiniresistens]